MNNFNINYFRPGKLITTALCCLLIAGCAKKEVEEVETIDPELTIVKAVPDLTFWIKAGSIPTQVDGTPVSVWKDSSGTQRAGLQDSASFQPVLRLNQLNQKPVVHFDGTQRLALDATFLLNTDYTIFIVGARETGAHSNFFLGGTTNAGRSNLGIGWRQDAGGFLPNSFNFAIFGNDIYASDGSFTTKSFSLWSARFSQTEGKVIHRNGVEFINDASKVASLIDTTGTMIGYWPLVSEGLEGDIAEIIIYTHALTSAERGTVETYLRNKYALF